MARTLLLAPSMKTRRIVLCAAVVTAAAVAACAGGSHSNNPTSTGTSDVVAAPAPAAGVLRATVVEAAYFEDDLANIDLVQVMAWDDSSHSGVFITVPATIAGTAGTYPLLSTDVGVTVRYGVSHEGENHSWDRQWYFAMYSGSLIVIDPATGPGDTVAVMMSNAVFVFEDEHHQMNPAVTANLQITDPALSAEMDDDPIDFCD